jgi:hypothetical protein
VLRWHLKHSKELKKYQRYREKTGGVPDAVKKAPRLPALTIPCFGVDEVITDPGCEMAWDAFNALTGGRQWTPAGGACGILFTEKTAWLDEYEIFDPDDREELMDLIAALDDTYRAHVNKTDDE